MKVNRNNIKIQDLHKRRHLRVLIRILKTDKRALAGFTIIALYIIVTIVALIIPADLRPRISERDQGPSLRHPLGTDYAGRDLLTMVMHGAPQVLSVSALTAVITVILATAIGLTAGYMGGVVDSFLMAFADIVLTIPSFPLIYILSSLLGRAAANPVILATLLSITAWAGLARAIRSQVLSIREEEFIEATKLLGLPSYHIVFREILPNILPYVGVNAIFAMLQAVYAQVGLYFLGALPYTPCNWGVMLNLAFGEKGVLYGYATGRIWQLIAPMLAISLLQVGLILSTTGIEKMLNPRLREE